MAPSPEAPAPTGSSAKRRRSCTTLPPDSYDHRHGTSLPRRRRGQAGRRREPREPEPPRAPASAAERRRASPRPSTDSAATPASPACQRQQPHRRQRRRPRMRVDVQHPSRAGGRPATRLRRARRRAAEPCATGRPRGTRSPVGAHRERRVTQTTAPVQLRARRQRADRHRPSRARVVPARTASAPSRPEQRVHVARQPRPRDVPRVAHTSSAEMIPVRGDALRG